MLNFETLSPRLSVTNAYARKLGRPEKMSYNPTERNKRIRKLVLQKYDTLSTDQLKECKRFLEREVHKFSLSPNRKEEIFLHLQILKEIIG